MDLANSSAHVNDSKNLRNAHIINKSYIVHRTSYRANAFPNAFALISPRGSLKFALSVRRRTLLIGKRSDTGEFLTLEELKRSASAC